MDPERQDPNESQLPEDSPEDAPVPPPEISQSAIDKRLRRLMAPNSKGESKLPTEIREQWADKYGREKVLALFEKPGTIRTGLPKNTSVLNGLGRLYENND